MNCRALQQSPGSGLSSHLCVCRGKSEHAGRIWSFWKARTKMPFFREYPTTGVGFNENQKTRNIKESPNDISDFPFLMPLLNDH
jgi:hypothetical protein